MRRTFESAPVSPDRTKFSIDAMSPVRRAMTSPRRRRSKKSGPRLCRCSKSFVRSESRKHRAPDEGQADVCRHEPRQRTEVPRHEDVVHHDLEEPDRRRLDRRVERDQQDAQEEITTEGPGVGPEAPEDLAHGHRRGRSHQSLAVGRGRQQVTDACVQAHILRRGALAHGLCCNTRRMDDAEILAARVAVLEHVVHRAFADQTVALNLETGQYHGLNATAAQMLDALEKARVVGDAVPGLARDLDQPTEVIERDLASLCRALAERGLIELRGPGAD
jgi:hypothetical protein